MVELPAANSGKWLPLIDHVLAFRELALSPGDLPPDCSRPARLLQSQKRLSGAEIEVLIANYVAGATVYQLADKFGCNRKTVSRLLKAHGVKLRLAAMSRDQVDQAEDLYAAGLSLAQVGLRLGVHGNTVRLRLVERGIAMRDSHGRVRT